MEMVTSSSVSVQQKAQVFHESDVAARHVPGGALQWLVDQGIGATHVMAYRLVVNPEGTAAHSHAGAEEVLYVLEGTGDIRVEAAAHSVRGGDAVFIPDGAEHAHTNTGHGSLVLVGALAPPIKAEAIRPVMPRLDVPRAGPGTLVHERAVAPTMMTEERVTPTLMGERSFRLLLNQAVGCRQMTQFTGVIPPGRAPLHAHPHEEAVYILGGNGRLWVDSEVTGELRPGSVIFIPIGVRHTLENTSGSEVLKVLGTFSPSGSPEAKLPER